ncbi:MAG TPA: GTPase CgtA [Lachnospiraceae bacterium]|nr:GTPase CgtA [Lachnospiraceae bacterium]
MFADRAKIYVRSGKGGDGHVSFRREKYVPNGGPDGGDGGDGGSVIFEIDPGLNTLTDFRHIRKYAAGDGEEGKKRNCRGKNGDDIIIKVPEGTVLRDEESGKIVADLSGDNRRVVLLTGGKGGNGNQHYATARMQAPKYAKPGGSAKEITLLMELKVLADVGLVGFPNVGKSTLLSHVSNARPKIANYHFTTLSPYLGVVDLEGGGFVMADIPGLIEGAGEGVGLGHEFLRHVERCRILIHVVDVSGSEGRDPLDDIRIINEELATYGGGLDKKPQVIAANKTDVCEKEKLDEFIKTCEKEGKKVYPISAVSGEGVKELLYAVKKALDETDVPILTFEAEMNPDVYRNDLDEPYSVTYDEKEKEYVVEGPRIEKMLGYTNLESEKGFLFFQHFMKDNGIIDELKALGMEEGDTVRLYGFAFEYYDDERD